MTEHLDVVVVGAGLSGIGAGYRLQTELPSLSYAILEMRDTIGGTWDLFRYPGVRSDSDMFTLGYPFRPWTAEKSIADGPTILSYIKDTAREFGIDQKIRYRTKVVGADFDTDSARWTVRLEVDGEEQELTCSFLYSCSGYYDYDNPHDPSFEGREDFAGTIVHPQFWPENLDYTGKNVVIIGSGATAVTLVPSMAGTAARVTMLQRTPTWIGAVPARDKIADKLREVLPAGVAHRTARAKNVALTVGFYNFCQRFPDQARKVLLGASAKALRGDREYVDKHLNPPYKPWDQRFCAVPDGDLFEVLRSGKAEIVTDQIDRFVPEGLLLKSGRVLPADIVVTATGLRLRALGGIAPSVDGTPVRLNDEFVWQGAMITGLPNFAVCIGYTNASWTLRADLTHRLVCRVLKEMKSRGATSVVPVADPGLVDRPLLDLTSGYVQRSLDEFPKQGDRGPWRVHQNYIIDSAVTMRRSLDTLRFSGGRVSKLVAAAR